MIAINSAKHMPLHSCATYLENITCAVPAWYSQHSVYEYFMMLLYLLKTKSIWTILLSWALHIDEGNAHCLSLYCSREHIYLVHTGFWTTHDKKTRESERAHSCFTEQLRLMCSASSSLPCKKPEIFSTVLCVFLPVILAWSYCSHCMREFSRHFTQRAQDL